MIKPLRFFALLSLIAFSAACGSKNEEPAPSVPPPSAAPEPTVLSAPMPAIGAKAELGKPAPDFALPDVDGKSIKLSELKGKTVVLEWFNPDCPFVKYARGEGELKTMASTVMGEELVWLSINSSGVGKQGYGIERNRAARDEYKFANPLLLDENGIVGRAYGAEKTPHLFVIGKDGNLIYRGAIDNAPIGKIDPDRPKLPDSKEGTLINYVSAALEDAKASQTLRLPETPAYGCSVKYSDS